MLSTECIGILLTNVRFCKIFHFEHILIDKNRRLGSWRTNLERLAEFWMVACALRNPFVRADVIPPEYPESFTKLSDVEELASSYFSIFSVFIPLTSETRKMVRCLPTAFYMCARVHQHSLFHQCQQVKVEISRSSQCQINSFWTYKYSWIL